MTRGPLLTPADGPRTAAAMADTLRDCGRLGPEHRALVECCRALERDLQAPAWRPIATAPLDGTPILLYLPDVLSERRILVGYWSGNLCRCWIAGGTTRAYVPPTHWMPLPDPPSDA